MTAPRSYGQNCSLARAMDLLGERWTVLIVRELARGPKRFGDLYDSLAGIGTTMLAARLKRLEGAEVIARADQASDALGDLMLWGLGLPEMLQPEDQSRAVCLAMNMHATLERTQGRPPAGTYAFHVGEERFWLHVDAHGHATLRDGTPPYPADATLIGTLADLHALATGSCPSDLDITIDGDHARLVRLLELLQIRSTDIVK